MMDVQFLWMGFLISSTCQKKKEKKKRDAQARKSSRMRDVFPSFAHIYMYEERFHSGAGTVF